MDSETTNQNGNSVDNASSENNQEREAVVNSGNQEAKELNEEVDKISEARQVINEMKAVNAERLKLIEREEKLLANQMISGKGKIGSAPREETPREYAERIMKGGR